MVSCRGSRFNPTCRRRGRARLAACTAHHGVLNHVFEADLTFLMKGCDVMRRVGVKNGFIIACAQGQHAVGRSHPISCGTGLRLSRA